MKYMKKYEPRTRRCLLWGPSPETLGCPASRPSPNPVLQVPHIPLSECPGERRSRNSNLVGPLQRTNSGCMFPRVSELCSLLGVNRRSSTGRGGRGRSIRRATDRGRFLLLDAAVSEAPFQPDNGDRTDNKNQDSVHLFCLQFGSRRHGKSKPSRSDRKRAAWLSTMTEFRSIWQSASSECAAPVTHRDICFESETSVEKENSSSSNWHPLAMQ